MTGEVLPQRKRLAHVPPVERSDRPVILFVTLTVRPRGNFLASDLFHAAFLEACREADVWSVGRYVIMPDHVHLFCAPARWPPVGVLRWVRYLKERCTKRLGKERLGAASSPSASRSGVGGRISGEPPCARLASGMCRLGAASPPRDETAWRWQSDCWDTQIRSGETYHEKWLYVRENPVRAGLVANAEDWPFQGELNVLLW